jgi:hypothetical protein
MNKDLYVVGSAWLQLDDDNELQLDEAAFECSSAALKDAGIRRGDVGLSVTSSLDLYDARSISNALTTPASAGYLNEELRAEGDVGAAMLLAMAALAGGQTELAIVVGLNYPEVGTTDETAIWKLREQVSSYTFEPIIDRPSGLSATTTFGLQASTVATDDARLRRLAEATARDINRGASTGRGLRPPTTADEVLAAEVVATPLTRPMLPAQSAAIGAIVIGVGVRALRTVNPLARIRGWGSANGRPAFHPEWLDSPGAAAGTAATAAYRRAGLPDGSSVELAEITDLTPAVTDDLVAALQLGHLDADAVNASGGPRANYPGIANGVLRAADASRAIAERPAGSLALSHSTDDLMGLIGASNTVLILESL